ncbi:carbon-phosphorus lyase subunit PhnH [Pseudomonas agarici]|uniref:Carbon-phosphorus lyase subunit PhnH n=1 Tax=Pseudomonas agarici TaxID=46677 RepID=A0A0X1SZ13_PSEAA|nr:phosphonate C-P lyase system protein PhnH [Pseudomonas agarici]AMB85061.1 carbon-phosphorus lyase subunit PhnH [Pseudomonas agarici]NWB93876.1 phosphonate C-P lyase system protein PhnH [Pseudomonas agarici]NWC08320.1 phosphonate C-P lyase system protein PhnH [Pseudomonas agarici]SEL87831.1 alpha-D-ribose 1-methylphosphonate 5-triphosphate synthase subunit PhnH [Pseudomonas agarici]
MNASLLQGAFADPVLDAQRSFRAALDALANPGVAQALPMLTSLDGLAPATYALCLALLDGDTPLWLAPSFDTPAIRANLAFHCACPLTTQREGARFALLAVEDLHDLAGFDLGNERYPDQSCTLLVQLPQLDSGRSVTWRGPGIRDDQRVSLPLVEDFWHQRERHGAFPLGLDVFFLAGGNVLGLPRSTRVSHLSEELA